MSVMASRRTFGAILGTLAAAIPVRAMAQFTEQEIIQNADVVSTGDVDINQSASNEASFGVYVDGELVTQDGTYQTSDGFVIVQNGRVVSTGDVELNQSASNSVSSYPTSDGQPVYPSDRCYPGTVMANPETGELFYQRNDCCWYRACAKHDCHKRCEGDTCGG